MIIHNNSVTVHLSFLFTYFAIKKQDLFTFHNAWILLHELCIVFAKMMQNFCDGQEILSQIL